MIRAVRPSLLSENHPPETAIHWPAVAVLGVIALLFVVGVGTLLLLAPGRTRPAEKPAVIRKATPPSTDPVPEQETPTLANMAESSPDGRPTAQPDGVLTTVQLPAQYPVEWQAAKPRPQPPERVPSQSKPAVVQTAAAAPMSPPPPEPVKVTDGPVVVSTESPRFRRYNFLYEEELLYEVQRLAVEVDLDTVKDTSTKLLKKPKEKPDLVGPVAPPPSVVDIVAQRPDLAGLPVNNGPSCEADKETAKVLQQLSRALRAALADAGEPQRREGRGSSWQANERANQIFKLITKLNKGESEVSTLIQVFQTDDKRVRLGLVKHLAEIKGSKATVALAQRALFDPCPDVREAAVAALQNRSRDEVRPILLQGLRYPWAPVADHAAEALATLGDRAAIVDLVGLLYAPDPAAPVRDAKKTWVAPQVVRVNHLRNCLLCHAPSFERTDLVRGPVPTPGKELPVVYYEEGKGPFARADITYLRQDFSVMHLVKDHEPWPAYQRFDYMVRTRPLSPEETTELDKKSPTDLDPRPYPQRNAVLFALRNLTGADLGESADDWFRYVVENPEAWQP